MTTLPYQSHAEFNPILEQYRSPDDDQNYETLSFSRLELAAVMRRYYDDLIAVVAQPAFQEFYVEMMALNPSLRPQYVADVMFQKVELERRGIVIPEDILVQTSAFGDRRPTLFALKKLLPEKYTVAWENVNLTFDNEYEDSSVPRTSEAAWRAPLPVALQNEMLASGKDLQSIPEEQGVSFGIYGLQKRPED
jgi:hypothetical protein